MKADRLTRIRERAYAIWEAEGRPHGRDVEHWARAANEIDAEDRREAAAVRARRGSAARQAEPAAAEKPAAKGKRPLVDKLTSVATNAVRAVAAGKAKSKRRGGRATRSGLARAADKPSTRSSEES